ncbi:MAG: alanine racemase [bacterium]
MNVSLEKLAEITLGTAHGGAIFGEVVTDSRRPFAAGALFVALKGRNFDGHEHVDDALARGCSCALVSEPVSGPHVLVDDTLVALQRLAGWWRRQFDIPVIGITGSNGKTIVKEMLASILSREMTVWRSPGSYNSQVGVALSLLGIRSAHDVAIIEAGISQPGEMDRLEAMIAPTIGVLTSIGNVHLAGLGTLENVAKEKRKLFAHAHDIFAPISVGPFMQGTTFHAVDAPSLVTMDADGASFKVADQTYQAMLVGEHLLQNAAMAIRVAEHLGLAHASIHEGLAAFELAPMRLEIHTTQGGITLINDAYSSDPISARGALATLQQYAGGARTFAILGDMLDLGSTTDRAHAELGELVAESTIGYLATLGPRSRQTAAAAVHAGMASDRVCTFDDLDALSEWLDFTLEPGDVVLFKGSRALGLERAAERLLESVAPTRLHINLDAIRENVRAVRQAVGHAGVMAVVKSFAYGNDATRVSQTLVREGIDWLAVAYADEAIPLRRRGLSVPILVTNTLAAEADKIVKYGLTGLVYSSAVVDALDRHAGKRGRIVDVHIEVDSGMGRVGVLPADALALAEHIRSCANVRLTGLMTHFSSADDPREDAYTLSQIAQFDAVRETLEAHGFALTHVHAANTAAAWRFPQARYDLVRVGLGLYGFHPSQDVAALAQQTRPALKFSTQIIHIKPVHAGDSISYGRRWKSPGSRLIATIAAGYNDGFSRFMSNGGIVLIGGQRCEVVGSVCMDVAMVDITHVPSAAVGDEVVIFGEQDGSFLAVEEMADRGNTINYEVLCKISPRVRRIFVREEA